METATFFAVLHVNCRVGLIISIGERQLVMSLEKCLGDFRNACMHLELI